MRNHGPMKNWILALLAAGLGAMFAAQLSRARPGQGPTVAATPTQVSSPPVALKDLHRAPQHKAAPVKQAQAAPSFGGYPCSSSDCAEDKAGFRWAQDHGIADPDDCTGNSGPFIEGCRVYAQRRTKRS